MSLLLSSLEVYESELNMDVSEILSNFSSGALDSHHSLSDCHGHYKNQLSISVLRDIFSRLPPVGTSTFSSVSKYFILAYIFLFILINNIYDNNYIPYYQHKV